MSDDRIAGLDEWLAAQTLSGGPNRPDPPDPPYVPETDAEKEARGELKDVPF